MLKNKKIEEIKNKNKKEFFIFITKIFIFSFLIISGILYISFSKIQELNWYDWVFFSDIFIGILASFLLAQNFKYSFIFLIIDALVYGTALIGQQNFASGAINILIIPLILLIPIFTYKNQELKIETKSLSKNKKIISLLIILFSSLIIFGITIGIIEAFKLESERSKWFLLIDSIISMLTICGFLFSGFRFKEAWICFMIMNLIRIIMYSILLSIGDKNISILSLNISIAFFLNHIIGFINWSKSDEKNK